MMMNLFSVFDPTSYNYLGLNWFVIFVVLFFFPLKYYLMESKTFLFLKKITFSVSSVFKEVSFPNHLAVNLIVVMIFMYLVFNNLLGLFPFIFSSTAHPIITMGLGLVMWMSFFLMGFFCNFKKSFAHLVPEGSPLLLSPLLVIIESISHLIRPFTLSIRMAANLMAGHLIMGLLSSVSMIGLFGFFSSLVLQNILFILEFGVMVIQGFVFSILLLLYALEYY